MSAHVDRHDICHSLVRLKEPGWIERRQVDDGGDAVQDELRHGGAGAGRVEDPPTGVASRDERSCKCTRNLGNRWQVTFNIRLELVAPAFLFNQSPLINCRHLCSQWMKSILQAKHIHGKELQFPRNSSQRTKSLQLQQLCLFFTLSKFGATKLKTSLLPTQQEAATYLGHQAPSL